MKLGCDLRCHICRDVPGGSEGGGRDPGGTMDALTLTVVCHEGTAARSCRLPHGIGAVPGQVATAAKPGEVLAVRDLLKALTDLAGAVITADALHA